MYIPENSQNITKAIQKEQNRRIFPLVVAYTLWLAVMAVLFAAALTYGHKWYIYLAMLPVTGTTLYIVRQLHVSLQATPLQVAQRHVATATEWSPAMLDLQWEIVTNLLQSIHQLKDMGYDQNDGQRDAMHLDLSCMQEFLHAVRPYGIGFASVQFTIETDHMHTRLEWMKAHCRHRQANMENIHLPFSPSPPEPKTLH